MMKRNEKDIFDRIVELADSHIDLCENSDQIFLQEEKIKAVKNLYQRATDWDNPNKDKYKVNDEMHGRIVGNVMSFNLMENEKYHEIEDLLEILERDNASERPSRSNTFAGMQSYYQKSKTFNYNRSPSPDSRVASVMDPIKEIKTIELESIGNESKTKEDGPAENTANNDASKGNGYW